MYQNCPIYYFLNFQFTPVLSSPIGPLKHKIGLNICFWITIQVDLQNGPLMDEIRTGAVFL